MTPNPQAGNSKEYAPENDNINSSQTQQDCTREAWVTEHAQAEEEHDSSRNRNIRDRFRQEDAKLLPEEKHLCVASRGELVSISALTQYFLNFSHPQTHILVPN